SAFSERSPSAAAAASALTTSGRNSRQRWSSSALSVSNPARVMIAVERGAGGRHRDMLPTVTSALAAENSAEHAAQDLPAELAAHGADGLLGHGFDHALATLGAEDRVVHRVAPRGTLRRLRGFLLRDLLRVVDGFLVGAPGQHLGSRFAVVDVSYLGPTGERERMVARSSSVIGPSRHVGVETSTRSTGVCAPLSRSVEASASPTPIVPITRATSSFGFGANVSAAALTAFWSRGVNACSACWMRLPIWPRITSGTSSGFCEQKYTPTPLER